MKQKHVPVRKIDRLHMIARRIRESIYRVTDDFDDAPDWAFIARMKLAADLVDEAAMLLNRDDDERVHELGTRMRLRGPASNTDHPRVKSVLALVPGILQPYLDEARL